MYLSARQFTFVEMYWKYAFIGLMYLLALAMHPERGSGCALVFILKHRKIVGATFDNLFGFGIIIPQLI